MIMLKFLWSIWNIFRADLILLKVEKEKLLTSHGAAFEKGSHQAEAIKVEIEIKS